MGVAAFKEDKKQKSSPAKRRARKQKSLIKQFKRLIPNTASAPLPKPPTPKFTPSVLPKLPGPGGMFVLDLASDLIFPKSTADADLDDLPPEASLEPFQPQQPAEPYEGLGDPPFLGGQGERSYWTAWTFVGKKYGTTDDEDEYVTGPVVGYEPDWDGGNSNGYLNIFAEGGDAVEYGGAFDEGAYEDRLAVPLIKNFKVCPAGFGGPRCDELEEDREQYGDPPPEVITVNPEAPNKTNLPKDFQPPSPEVAPDSLEKPTRDVPGALSLPSLDPAKGTDPFKEPSAETLTTTTTETAAPPASQTATGTVTTTATPEEATTASKFAPLTTGTVPTAFTAAGTSANNSRLPNSSAFEEPKSPPTTKPPDPCRSPDRCSSKGLDLLDDLLDLVSLIRDNNCCDEILSILKGEYNGLNYTEYCATDENGEKSYKSEAIKYETEGLQSAMQLLQTSVTGEIEKLKRKLLCEEFESNVVFPSGWNIRPEYWRPQLVIKFRGKSENGKLTNSWWSITVPHYNGQTRPQTSPIQEYRRGSVEGILTLNDNSKVTVHCASEGQALYILEGIRAYIDPKQTDGSYIKTGMIRSQSPIKTVNVVPWDAKYYSQGAKGQNPDWVAYFAPT